MHLTRNSTLLALALLACGAMLAQDGAKTEPREIYFRISNAFKYGDSMYVFADGVTELGLKPGIPVNAYQTPSKLAKRTEFRQAGSGRVVRADTMVVFFIKLFGGIDTLAAGDAISLKLPTPVLPGRTILSELAFHNIFFIDFDQKPFYSLQQLLHADSPRQNDSIYQAFLKDLHDTYEKVKDRNLDSSLTRKAVEGRYIGKSAVEVLRDATRPDVESFLIYANDFFTGYTAKQFRLSESFAGWVSSNAPYSCTEIKNDLFPVYKNKQVFDKLIPKYKHDILAGNVVTNLSLEAAHLEYSKGVEFLGFVNYLAASVNDTVGQAVAHLFTAEFFQDHEKYKEAIDQCDEAAKYAREANHKDYESQAIIKKIFCLYKNGNFNDALILLESARAMLSDYKSTIGDNLYQRRLESTYEYEGGIYYKLGDYTAALKAYAQAVDINKKINSYDAILRNADHYTFIGRVYNDQGKPNDALESFTSLSSIYWRNFDTLNWARIQNDIAYSYYILGSYRISMDYCNKAIKYLLPFQDYNSAGYSKSLSGSCFWELGKYDSAVMAHRESISLRKLGGNISGQADSWKQIGELYLLSGLKKNALAAYDSSAMLYDQIKDSAGLAQTYNKKGKVFLNDENYKVAVEFFEKAKGFTSKTTVESLCNLGDAWREIDTSKAISYYMACKKKADSTGNLGYSFAATKALSWRAYKGKNTKLGDKLYEECVTLSKQLKTPTSTAYCYALKGDKYSFESELDSALVYYNKAFQVFDSVNRDEAIWQLNNIASVYISRGDFAEAETALIKAIQTAKSASDNVALGYSLEASSFLYGLTGEFAEGIKNSDSAIAIFNRSGNILRLANSYLSRGTLLKGMGEYKESIKSFLFADSVYQAQMTSEYRHTALCDIGVTYYSQYDYQTALNYFDMALKQLKKDLSNETYLLYRGNYAECEYYLKRYAESEKNYLEVLPPAREKKLNRIASGFAIGLGKLYYDTKREGQAIQYFSYARDYAFSSGEKEKIVESLTYLGRIKVQHGGDDSAEANFRKAISVAAQFKTVGGWEPNYELGLMFYNHKKYDSSITYFRRAVDLLDKDAENLYGGEEAKKIFNNDPRKADLYNKITFAYYNTGNEKEAWAYANRSNIAGLKELSGSLSTNTSDKDKSEVLKRLLSLQQSKKALENTAEKQTGEARQQTLKKIEIMEADYTNFLQDIVETYPDLGSYFAKSNADQFYDYKSKIPNDVAVALYLVNDKTLMIFTLTNEKLAIDTMTADIAKTVSAFIAATKHVQSTTSTGALHLRSEPTDEDETTTNIPFKDLSNELYNVLITPVNDKIKNKKRLCIIPTGIFSNMPFQCLGQRLGDSTFHFLVEDYAIFYTNQMKVFDATTNSPAEKNDLVSFAAFGVPDQTLHYNTQEVKQIGKIMGIDSTIYADNRATESMAKFSLTHKKYIHFATHGVLNYSSQFSKSYLKFLPDKDTSTGNNGQLTIREIQSLPIEDCDLVTLSACETAISKEVAKGWTISPANSFLERRVKSVVASLWKVDDEATSILMDEFYSNLNKKMDKVDALRLAQETLSKNPRYSHPFYWGAFVLYGEWR